ARGQLRPRPAAVPRAAQGRQGRLPPLRRQLLHEVPAGGTSAADGRHGHEPRRVPLRVGPSAACRAGRCAVTERLPSWRAGPVRDALLEHLDRSLDVPLAERVAYLDNDGTMWCEKPSYVQLDFFVDALRTMAEDDPSLRERPELAAVLGGDAAEVARIGLPQVA